MKVAGIILLIIGFIGTLLFGIQALSNSESFSFLGLDFAVSSANWMPVIVSLIIVVFGGVLIRSGKK